MKQKRQLPLESKHTLDFFESWDNNIGYEGKNYILKMLKINYTLTNIEGAGNIDHLLTEEIRKERFLKSRKKIKLSERIMES